MMMGLFRRPPPARPGPRAAMILA